MQVLFGYRYSHGSKNAVNTLYHRSAEYAGWLIVSPAIPLAIYFSLSTMLQLVPAYLGINRPAYWIFSYLGVCVAWRLRYTRPGMHATEIVALLFLASIFLSWVSTGLTGGTRAALLMLSSAVIPWTAVKVFSDVDIARFLRWVALFGGVICLAYLSAIPFFYRAATWERVPFLEGVAYGVLGPTVGLLAVMSATYLMRKDLKLAWAALSACVLVIIHMGARGMFASLCLTLIVASVLIHASWRRKLAIWCVVLVSALVASMVIPEARLHHFLRLALDIPVPDRSILDIPVPDRSIDDTIAIRLALYREAFQLFLAMPLTGVGVGRFGLYTALNEELTTPHSTVFQVLAELGLAGVLPFGVMNLMLLWLAFKARTRTLSSIVAFAWMYFAVFDQISANYLSSLRYYLFSALLVAISLNSPSERAILPHRVDGVAGKGP